MAIIIEGKSTCSLCGKILEKGQTIVAWTAFLPSTHVLWKYSDTGMHKSCFEVWKHKQEFEELYEYQPMIDFNDPNLKERIKKYGLPEWLRKLKEFRNKK